MQKLKLTKDKLTALVKLITFLIDDIEKNKHSTRNWDRIMANAHLFVLKGLSQKMRSKLITLEGQPGDKRVTYTIDAIQAAILMSYEKKVSPSASVLDPHTYSVYVEISGPLHQKLLS